MFSKLIANTVYVKVYKNRFDLHHVESGNSTSVISPNAFTTTRLLVGQFSEADETLRKGMKELYKNQLFAPSPVVVIQPMEKTENGLSQVEERTLQELAAGAGARKSIVWVGHELSDQEALSKANDV
ncbi:MAG: 1-pyrroline-5-carboxylate dehydrogenase [Candidatus Thiodiazotropha sp. (ex Troendleina suluensis)]|nr:1-pyrroline-5-carboxylate dehydrogenase [Candidatus Thiodiazotropha sp. (ex Troendleina suluensis)]